MGDQHTPNWRSRFTLAYENRRDQAQAPQDYLRDANGRTIWGDGNNATRDAPVDGQAINVDNSLFGTPIARASRCSARGR